MSLSDALSAAIDLDNATGWSAACILQLVNAVTLDPSADLGLVDGRGNAVSTLTEKTWGISLASCRAYCDEVPSFDLAGFANSFTNWLLPWLGLMAQLPFETGNAWQNLLSLCLAIGSPFFAAYSLTITIMNRMWLHSHYKRFMKDWPADQTDHLTGVFGLLSETQHLPMRTSVVRGGLPGLSLVVNSPRWCIDVDHRLQRTRRGWTASFWAQTLAAITAWALTVTGSIASLLGNDETALNLSASSLWLWMIPLVIGWVSVGTQTEPKTVHDAINTQITVTLNNGAQSEIAVQTAIGILREAYKPTQWREEDHYDDLQARGDEASLGPIFNYARIWTWRRFCVQVMEQLTLPPSAIPDNEFGIAKTFFLASVVGGVLQWCTTGPSILIAYNTPTVGLGCSSGGYLIYGLAATFAWACLVISQVCSFHAMKSPGVVAANNGVSEFNQPQTRFMGFLRCAARGTRLLGKSVAFLNACWVLAASLFEVIGFYDNCTCKAVEFSLHEKGWIALFKSNSQLATAARSIWAGGIVWMTLSMVIIAIFFRTASRSSFKG